MALPLRIPQATIGVFCNWLHDPQSW